MKITREQLAGMIDHSLLRPQSTREELKKLCAEAVAYGIKAVCVNPVHVADAAALLKGESPIVCSVVGFPFGTHTPAAKAAEAAEVIRLGAREVDMVLRVGALKEDRDDEVAEDIAAVVRAAGGCPVKVIIETCYLTEAEKVRGCLLAVQAGATFVKTSTGFGSAGATVADVRMLRRTVGEGIGVKAAGGIRTLADALAMIEAGANRIGASASVAILSQLEE
ncbi:MAG: deoxyribose-phosphate aldolase [Syntrophobacterales bacterium CG_4_8_14_3_um_filter_58_8]|nr:MAG: deoxyribose-phosphate aldolase [Syntrophaceae bacterium CG2_30_58_14]PIV03240.1 MAG: deoxyribose-phosphate aldolase [Syntrophobacterales bacterium CG03_land_8_20_14_0_80_58_14]PJC73023.1 MAG: deoxyribose-phosphate aldolase [Syntrophobacterales bacterium CG_4_8_14_3_um_filter_58_8]